ncbi:MAG: NUDIX domain-containing protein [Candidatus Hydrothermia bacterium]
MLSFTIKPKFCPYCGNPLIEKTENGNPRLFCQKCQVFIYRNPVPVVATVISNEKGEILLIKRKVEPAKGKWALPSGFVELNEEPEESAKRELEEETGITVPNLILLNVFHQESKRYESVLVISYFGESNATPAPGDDAEEARFFKYEEALSLIAFDSHKRAVIEASKFFKKP